MAAAMYLDADFDDQIYTGGDAGHDLVLRDGTTVAVKFNHRWRGYLMIEVRPGDTRECMRDLHADVVVLVGSNCDPQRNACTCRRSIEEDGELRLYLWGWLDAATFRRNAACRDLGLGGRWIVRPDDLFEMRELRERMPSVCRWMSTFHFHLIAAGPVDLHFACSCSIVRGSDGETHLVEGLWCDEADNHPDAPQRRGALDVTP
jgi:hypothetical protein